MTFSTTSFVAQRGYHNGSSDLPSVLQTAVLNELKVAAHFEVLRQGDTPRFVHVVLSGYMCRYRTLADGRRQTFAVLIPGDICDIEAVLIGKADYSVSALSAGRLGRIAIGRLEEMEDLAPHLRQFLFRQILRDGAISREWAFALGRLSAVERMAHLFCELWTRLQFVGLAQADGCELNISQAELGDILGLSTVHVNRMLQELRRAGLIQLTNDYLRIFDHAALAKVANFDPSYLQAHS